MNPQIATTRTEHGTVHTENLPGGWTWQWIKARSARHAQSLMDKLGWRSYGNAESVEYSRAAYDAETHRACLYFTTVAEPVSVVRERDLLTLNLPF